MGERAEPQGNGTREAPPSPERETPREYHAEPRPAPEYHEPAPAPREPAPLAHFEPQPKPETGGAQGKPYVVWSSAPPPSDTGGGRGPEE